MTTQVYLSCSPFDEEAAAWALATLEGAGHDVERPTDQTAGAMSVVRAEEALAEGRRILALLTDDFFLSSACMAEAFAALQHQGEPGGGLVAVRLTPCTPTGILSGVAYIDLVGLSEEDRSAKLLEALTGAVAESSNETTQHVVESNAPPLDRDAYCERVADLAALKAALTEAGRDTAVALVGSDGVGKHTLARAYCDQFGADYDLVWWVPAGSTHTLIESLATLAARLDPLLAGVSDINALAREALRRVSAWPGRKPVLMVFADNPSIEALDGWRVKGAVRTLIVTRDAGDAADVSVVGLPRLSVDEAAGFVQTHASQTDKASAKAIARSVRGMPLSLTHAIAHLRENPLVKPEDYVARVEGADRPRIADPDLEIVATTCGLAIADVVVSQPAALAVLSIAAWCAPARIPVELIKEAAEYTPDTAKVVLSDPERLETTLNLLERYALITREEDEHGAAFSMHPVLQLLMRDRATREKTSPLWAGAAIEGAAAVMPGGRASQDKWGRMAWLVGHAVELDRSAPHGAGDAARGLLVNQAGLYLQARVDFAAAEPHYRRALSLFEAAFGSDHQHVATALHNLATLLQSMGLLQEAERLMRRAVRIDEAVHGRDDPVVAGRLFTLVQLLQARERYSEAAPLQRRVVDIYEATLGSNHPTLGMALGLLAELLQMLGSWDEAEDALRRALVIDEATFGPDHPNIAIALNNLAHLVKSAKRMDEAEELMRRALAIDEAAYGADHPEVATDVYNFARLLQVTGRLSEAEEMLRRAISIWEAAYSADHPDTLMGAETLIQVLREMGQSDEATKIADEHGVELETA